MFGEFLGLPISQIESVALLQVALMCGLIRNSFLNRKVLKILKKPRAELDKTLFC